MSMNDVDPRVVDFACYVLSDSPCTPSPTRVMSLASDIQSAINAWCYRDEQQADEQRKLRGYSDGEKARI